MPPKKGSALIFPTATLEGLADERYLHSGEPVGSGTKWIVGTWLMERQRTDAADVAKAIDELWKLEGRSPPKRAAALSAPKAAAKPSKKAEKGAKKDAKNWQPPYSYCRYAGSPCIRAATWPQWANMG